MKVVYTVFLHLRIFKGCFERFNTTAVVFKLPQSHLKK